ncbi:hypothetical protein AMECASPLE_014220 [Ameca splendens]|uniref:Uncharacterized protein n=1 Tax=Ameca splendens TaxID=208324 RepID=A0ABV0ZBC6_9TELE
MSVRLRSLQVASIKFSDYYHNRNNYLAAKTSYICSDSITSGPLYFPYYPPKLCQRENRKEGWRERGRLATNIARA